MLALVTALLACGLADGGLARAAADRDNSVEPAEAALAGTELVQAFVVCRHGDRTPDEEELQLFPHGQSNYDPYFPFGLKALTNAGKARGYRVGELLRRRYAGLLSRLYLPDEIAVRCTDYDRTKMTALTAMAALYPPEPLQRWNPDLLWQPVPYSVMPKLEDDLLYWYYCPAYLRARDDVYSWPEVRSRLQPYADLFRTLSNYTGTNISTPEDVFYLDNLFQAEQNIGIDPPEWAQQLMAQIKEMTKIEYDIELYNDKLVRLASGVLLDEILNVTGEAVRGATPTPRLRLYSAHENNVAAMMAAARVFYPHQPNYGATFALELRRVTATGKYAFTAAYAPDPAGDASLIPVAGCGGGVLCDYETFVALTAGVACSRHQYEEECADSR